MTLPYIPYYSAKNDSSVAQFGGLDERLVVNRNVFHSMQNLSDRFFPAIATREPRSDALDTYTTPRGIYWKNNLFWIDGTQCCFGSDAISGMTVTAGEKRIVGMGAYIIVFPDKKVFNTATGEVTAIDASYSQSGTITFAELSTDSVYCKITASGIDDVFRQYDGVKFDGVNDSQFLVNGEGATKVITETGDDYIVVTASIQNAFVGEVTMEASGGSTKVSGSGIGSNFKVNDVIRVAGCADDALNVEGKTVTAVSTNYITINFAFPSKTYTQTSSVTFSPYYSGSSQVRVYAADLGDTFDEGDVVTIAGCTTDGINGTYTVKKGGTNYFLIDLVLTTSVTQASGITVTRSRMTKKAVTVKRTSFSVASGITISRESPDMDYVCEHENRLWGCSSLNHEIYASKLGDPTNWNCYEGVSTDSYTVTVGSDGDFTGCIAHMGQVLFFKESYIHTMYGSKPTNFQLNTKQLTGVRDGCDRSLVIVNETLFYVGRDGVYSFDGASPKKISEVIESEITDAVGCQQDSRYYLSCLKDGEQALLVYHPAHGIWHQEDDTEFRFACYGDGKLWYVDGDNALRNITGDSDDIIEWFMESGDLRESSLDEKYITKAKFNFTMEAGAEANIFFRYDDDPIWERKGTIHCIRHTTYTLPIIARRCNKFRWRIEGKGQMKLLAMGVTVEGGSELNGNLQSWYRR